MNTDMDMSEQRPGDLCTTFYKKWLASDIIQYDDCTGWGSFKSSSHVEAGTFAIVISCFEFPRWIYEGGASRVLLYVLTPEAIGWDDYGNYDVETRPALASLRHPEGHFIRKKRNS